MSIVEALAQKALDQVESRGDEWFDKLIEQATAQLPDENTSGPFAREGRIVGEAALMKLAAHKDDLLHLGKEGLTAMLAHLAAGKTHEATLVYLREKASWSDLFAASAAAAQATVQDKHDREARKARAIALLKDIGMGAAKAALPLLLAAI